MGWFESIRTAIPPLLYDGILTVLIILISTGLAWGIRPAIQFLSSRLGPKWSKWIAVLGQVLCLLAGMALIAIAVGVNAVGLTLAIGLAFFVGMMAGGETALADRIATMRILRRKLYQVGDHVTVGHNHHGVVQQIKGTTTRLIDAHHATVLVRNSRVLREPVIVHHAVGHPGLTRTASELAALHLAPVTTLPSAAHPTEAHVAQAVVGGLQNEERVDEHYNTAHRRIEQGGAEQAAVPAQKESSVVVATVADVSVTDTTAAETSVVETSVATVGTDEIPADADALVAVSVPKQLSVRHRSIRNSVANTLTKRPTLGKRSVRELR